MNNDLPDSVATTFIPDLKGALVDALETTYHELPSEDEMPGFDNTLTGLALYRLPQHWLPQLGDEFGLEVVHENNALLYRVGDQVFTCQRVSTTATSIRGAFPRSYKAGLHQFFDYQQGQHLFDFMEIDYGNEPPLVLAHMGNREDGLLGAYLCRPGLVQDGKVLSWEFAHPLLEPSASMLPSSEPAQVPAVEAVEEAVVRPRRERTNGAGA